MRPKDIEIVRFLIGHKEELNINQIAKHLKKDYKNVHDIITRLSRTVINLDPFGKSYRVRLRTDPHPLIFEAEYRRREQLLKNKTLAILADSFNALRSRLYILLVFGSYAKGTQTKQSDIDLLFIIPDASDLEKDIQNIANTLPLNIHLNIFTEHEFKAMRDSKERTVGSEAIGNNIIIHGIESYYELMQ
jgi:predicted nucleotidyltransferase